MATAMRWVMVLALVDIRWTSDEGVRCGRIDLGGSAEAVGDGGVLGGVVEIARTVVVFDW